MEHLDGALTAVRAEIRLASHCGAARQAKPRLGGKDSAGSYTLAVKVLTLSRTLHPVGFARSQLAVKQLGLGTLVSSKVTP